MLNINRNNYEEIFVSFLENELSEADKKMVIDFVAQNQDLKKEFDLLFSTKLIADEKIIFSEKENLIKQNSAKLIWFSSSKIKWSIAAMLLLMLGLGWLIMNGKLKNENEKLHANNNSTLKTENKNLKKQLAVIKNDSTTILFSSKKNIQLQSRKNVQQNFIAKKEIPQTIDTADLESASKNKNMLEKEHEIYVVQEIKPEEIVVTKKNILPTDSEKIVVKNISSEKKSTEKILVEIPLKVNHQQTQIIKMLAWLSGKITDNQQQNSNFDISLGIVEISHREALAKN
jgi:hypothetical protein